MPHKLLLPYDQRCPKCLCEQAVVKYCNGRAKLKGFPDSNSICQFPPYDLPWGQEHLHTTCTSCGYEWLTECADYEYDTEGKQ